MLIPNLKPRFDIPKLPSHLTFEISPVPELIFLRTVKGLLSFLINLSLLDSSLILTIIFLINFNPPVRKKATTALTFLFLLFGLEIAAVNVYALVRNLITETGYCIVNNQMTNSISCAPGFPHRLPSSLLQSSSWEYSTALLPSRPTPSCLCISPSTESEESM
ncbi:hypothetical protein BGW80DRAFT_657897 [Lactifluus volemus]|nr:hypothetical protein BGW80DRAFT_657897 [Lactifluus volemus]